MKNTRSYKLLALMLAVIMIIGVMPVLVNADGFVGPIASYYSYTAKDASFSFASDGEPVGSVADLNPTKASTMTVTVPDSEGLPQDSNGITFVSVPENVIITAENAAACEGTGVSCTYRAASNKLAFKWTGEPQKGFSATLPITPDVPSTINVSGRYVIVGVKEDGSLVGSVKAQTKNSTQLQSPQVKTFDGKLIFDDNSYYIWTFTNVTGDWYTISDGQYLRMQGETVVLTDKANATIFHIKQGSTGGYVIESNGYYLNIKNGGVKGSNWAPVNQWMKLYSTSEILGVESTDGKGYIKFDKNGGNIAVNPEMLVGEIGTEITLPNYAGTKSGKRFIGWAEVSNIRNVDPVTKLYRYYDVYLPGAKITVNDALLNLYAVWMDETGENVEFGIKKDGQIPYEPGNYPTAGYTQKKVKKEKALIDAKWVVDPDATKAVEGNHIRNAVTENLRDLPTDAEIKGIYSEYDPETMHVLWYVIKWMGKWKVDGVVIKNSHSISVMYYPTFTGNDVKSVYDLPQSYKLEESTKIVIGKEQNGKTYLTPYREGYNFLGWTTTADGSGTVYQSGDEITVNENISFYAQWEKIPSYKVSFSLNNAAKSEIEKLPADADYQKDNVIELPVAEDRMGYIFSGWTINGEKIDGDSFAVPEEDVEVAGTYYGPIDIEIVSNWPDGQTGYWGARINLNAILTGADGLDCTIQWQYLKDGEWANWKEPTLNRTTSYELNEETSGRIWRVIVTDAKPHQD